MARDTPNLKPFWQFLWLRPGLEATRKEWRHVMGGDVWDSLRHGLLKGEKVARNCTDESGKFCTITHLSDGYALVDHATGDYVARGLEKEDVQSFRLSLDGLRRLVSSALSIEPDKTSINHNHEVFPVGSWRPTAMCIPVYSLLPSTEQVLRSEIDQLLLSNETGFLLLVPLDKQIESIQRQQIEKHRGMIVPLLDTIGWSGDQLIALRTWEKFQQTYRQKHLLGGSSVEGPEYQFLREGMWTIRYRGTKTSLKGDLKGARYIHHLLQHQGHAIHVTKLTAEIEGVQASGRDPRAEGLNTDRAEAQVAYDEQTKRQCKERFDALVAERDSGNATDERLEEIDTEISGMAKYFSSSDGLGGKSRKLGDDVDAARRRITGVIGTVYKKIEENDPELATHLRNAIKTSTEMIYNPDQEVDWVLK